MGGNKHPQLVELVVGGRLLPENLEVNMEDIKLNSEGTQGFTLVLHELMTNAVNYGAAAWKRKGWIFVEGRAAVECERRIYQLVWREKGGPK